MWKKELSLYAITILITLFTASFRTIIADTLFIITSFILLSIFTYIALQKNKHIDPSYAVLLILAGVCTIMFLPRLFLVNSEAILSLISPIGMLLSVLLGYVSFKIAGKMPKIIFSVIATAFMVCYATIGEKAWANRVTCGTFVGKIEKTANEPITLLNEKGDATRIDQRK